MERPTGAVPMSTSTRATAQRRSAALRSEHEGVAPVRHIVASGRVGAGRAGPVRGGGALARRATDAASHGDDAPQVELLFYQILPAVFWNWNPSSKPSSTAMSQASSVTEGGDSSDDCAPPANALSSIEKASDRRVTCFCKGGRVSFAGEYQKAFIFLGRVQGL